MNEFLAKCRLLMIVPVIGCVFCSVVMILLGTLKIITSASKLVTGVESTANLSKVVSLAVIEIIDFFLVATVAYVAALGLYKLFISSADVEMPMLLKIHSLADLENKIIGVIVAALAVAFMGKATGDYEAQTMMYYGGGIALVVAALGLFVFLTGKPSKSNEDSDDSEIISPQDE